MQEAVAHSCGVLFAPSVVQRSDDSEKPLQPQRVEESVQHPHETAVRRHERRNGR